MNRGLTDPIGQETDQLSRGPSGQPAIEGEPSEEEGTRQHFPGQRGLLFEEADCRKPDLGIAVGRAGIHSQPPSRGERR